MAGIHALESFVPSLTPISSWVTWTSLTEYGSRTLYQSRHTCLSFQSTKTCGLIFFFFWFYHQKKINKNIMLAADKLQLQSALKQQAVSLKEKEFNLHHTNLMTVGTQASVLAGLDITMFIEFQPAPDGDWGPYENVSRMLKLVYYTIIVAAFCCNMMVVSQTTVLSVLGAGLALRGPDGSMMVATEALYDERVRVFSTFGRGLALTVSSVLVSVWLVLRVEAAIACWCIAACACYSIYTNFVRVRNRLHFDENETVDFRDIMEGPAAISYATPSRNMKNSKGKLALSNPTRWLINKSSSNMESSRQRQPPPPPPPHPNSSISDYSDQVYSNEDESYNSNDSVVKQ
jgi:hypothetical protein